MFWAERPPLRLAFSTEALAGANVNDARAAYRIWDSQANQRLGGRHIVVDPRIFIPLTTDGDSPE